MHEPLTHPKLIHDVLCRAIDQFNAADAKALLKPGNNGTGGPNEPAIGTQLITRIVEALRHYPASVRVDRGRGRKPPRSGVRFARPPIRSALVPYLF